MTAILPDLFGRWSSAFAKTNPGVAVTSTPPYGPPQGKLSPTLDGFLRGKSSFALTSRDLTAEDLALYHAANGTAPLVVPLANGSWRHFGFVDTVVVIVNARNPLRSVSLPQLKALFAAQHSANTWGDFGLASWKDRPIHIHGAAQWASEDSARSAILHRRALHGGPWRSDMGASGSEADAPTLVAADLLGIALTGLGHLPKGTRPLAIAPAAGQAAVAPSLHNVSLNRYPLSRTVDLLLHPAGTKLANPAAAEFARFALSRKGQEIVAHEGVFLPLRGDQARAALGLLGSC